MKGITSNTPPSIEWKGVATPNLPLWDSFSNASLNFKKKKKFVSSQGGRIAWN